MRKSVQQNGDVGEGTFPDEVTPEPTDSQIAEIMLALEHLRGQNCVLCELEFPTASLSSIPTEAPYNSIEQLRWSIMDIDRDADKCCLSCLKWLEVYATCVIPKERTGIYADEPTIPVALQSIVNMQYNEEQMTACENADDFYNMSEHSSDHVVETVAELAPNECPTDSSTAAPSPMPPPPLTPMERPVKVRKINICTRGA